MLHPTGTFLLTMRLFLLVGRQLEFCRAILIVGVMTLGPLGGPIWRLDLRGGAQLRWLVSPLSLAPLLVGLPHDASRLQGEGPLEERRQLRISFLM